MQRSSGAGWRHWAGVAAAAVSMAAAPAWAAEPVKRPLQLKVAVVETVIPIGLPPCFALGTVQGAGRSDLLGRFFMSSLDCINPLGTYDPGGRNVFAFGSQTPGLVFTAGNGDRLYAAYSGTIDRTGVLRGHFVITGGTGGFFGATGGGRLSGLYDTSQIGTVRGTVEADGEVTY